MVKMWIYGIIFYSTLITLVNSHLFPLNHDITYEYRATVKTTTETPILFESGYDIDAKIKVVRFGIDSIISINDINYTVYSGQHGKIFNKIPIPNGAESLKLPFLVHHIWNGKLAGISTDRNDDPWSVNMKQAIASLFQLDLTQLEFDETTPYAFYTKEPTVYGECNIFYNVIPTNNTRQTIRKMHNPLSCEELKLRNTFNVNPSRCVTEYQKPLMLYSERLYNVDKLNDDYLIDSIESINTVTFIPFNGKVNPTTVVINQSLNIVDVVTESKNNITDEMIYQINKQQFSSVDGVHDMTEGRHLINTELTWKKILINLRNIVEYLKTSHVTLTDNIEEQKGDFYNLIRLTRDVDEKILHSYFTELYNNKDDVELFNIFVEILPFIGTNASSSLIKYIAINKILDDYKIIKLLRNMPFYIKYPDKIILRELSVLLKDDMQLSNDVLQTATIAFATIISKVLIDYPADLEINTYIYYFIQKFNQTTDYDEKLLYINALRNIESDIVYNFIMNLIFENDDVKINSHIRSMAIWAVKSMKLHYTTPVIYWPLLTDLNEDIEVRAAALSVLMSESSLSHMLKIYWYMQSIKYDELYNLYYTKLESIGKSTVPCKKSVVNQANLLLQYAPKPGLDNRHNNVYVLDYFDSTYGFGASVKTTVLRSVKNDNFISFYIQLTPQIGDYKINQKAFYVRLDMKNIPKAKNFLPNKISKLISLLSNDMIGFEIITMQNNRVTSVYHCNPGNCKNTVYTLFEQHFTETKSALNYNIELVVNGEIVIPTDIGVPSVFFVQMPTLEKLESLIKLSLTKEGAIDVEIRRESTQWNQQICGLSVYNPIADVWHGNKKYHLVNAHVPIDFTLSFNPAHGNIMFVMRDDHDEYQKNSGYQSFVYNQMFISDDDEKNVQTACPQCKPTSLVTNGKRFRKEYIIWESDSEYVGIGLKVIIFDCENQISESDIIELRKKFTINYNENVGKSGVSKLFITMRYVWAFITISPMPGMCGYGILMKRNNIIPNARADLTITNTFNHQYDPKTFSPYLKWNLTGAYNIRQHDEIMKSWNVNLLLNGNKRKSNLAINVNQLNFNNIHKSMCIIGKENLKDQIIEAQWDLYNNKNNTDKFNYKDPIITVAIRGYITKLLLPIHYEYNITHKNDEVYTDFWLNVFDSLRNKYSDYFKRYYEIDTNIKENDIKIIIDNPKDTDKVNMHISTSDEDYGYEGISNDGFYWPGVILPHVLRLDAFNSPISVTDYCKIDTNYLMNVDGDRLEYSIPKKWTQLAASCNTSCDWEVYGKQNESNLAIRLIVKGEIYDISYENGIVMKFNNSIKTYHANGYYSTSWFKYKISENGHGIYINVEKFKLSLSFYLNSINLQMPATELSGICYEISL